jgi:hypothetical protein
VPWSGFIVERVNDLDIVTAIVGTLVRRCFANHVGYADR